jgi:hypothetical protein
LTYTATPVADLLLPLCLLLVLLFLLSINFSRPVDSILREVEVLSEQGVREVTLLGKGTGLQTASRASGFQTANSGLGFQIASRLTWFVDSDCA